MDVPFVLSALVVLSMAVLAHAGRRAGLGVWTRVADTALILSWVALAIHVLWLACRALF